MARSVVASLAFSAVLAVVACAPKTDLPVPDTRLPASYEVAPGTDRVAGDTLDRWWGLFGDAQLTGLIEEALTAAPDARTALGRLREGRANRDQALADFWPKGNLVGSFAQQNSRTKYFSFGGQPATGGGTGSQTAGGFFNPQGDERIVQGSFQPTWELDVFGDISVARRGANADLAAARFDYEATRMSLAAQVATDLFQARGLAVQLADARDNLRIATSLAGSGARKVAAGLAATSDTARLDADAATARSEVARLESALHTQQRNLLLLVGRGVAPLASLPVEPTIAKAPAVPAATPGELLVRRPDVRRSEAQLASAASRVQLDKLALFPRLTLEPGISLSRSTGAYSSFSRLWSLGVGLNVPILDRPRLMAEIRAQTARGQQAVVAYELSVQRAYADADIALTTVKADEIRVAALTEALNRSRFAFDAATIGYKAGLTDLTFLLQAETSWRNARAQLTLVQTAALQDTVSTFKALGGGWSPTGVDPSTKTFLKTARN